MEQTPNQYEKLNTHSRQWIFELVLANAGAKVRDADDVRVVDEVGIAQGM